MSEREGWSAEGPAAAAEVAERIRVTLTEAEGAAAALRHQAEQEAQARRRAAETEALRITEDARREAERFLADRIQRVSALSDEILERGQSVVERLEEAEQVRAELAGLVTALGETAARLANEVRSMPGPRSPDIAPAPSPSPAHRPVEPAAEPEPDPDPEPAAAAAEPEPAPPAPLEPNAIAPAPLRDAGPAPAQDEPPEPTPLRPEADEPPAAAAAAPEATPEEIELLERVRAAERDRSGDAAPRDGGLAANGAAAQAEEGDGGDEQDVVALHEPEPSEPAPEAGSSDETLGARLVALQMAVAGGNRGEVEAHLRRAFDLGEPAEILDDIFGSGTDSDKRVVWPEVG